jgi:hypothetical protein
VAPAPAIAIDTDAPLDPRDLRGANLDAFLRSDAEAAGALAVPAPLVVGRSAPPSRADSAGSSSGGSVRADGIGRFL